MVGTRQSGEYTAPPPQYIPQAKQDFMLGSFVASVSAHLLLAVLIFTDIIPGFDGMPEPVVYSVTLESSQFVGGISQVPKDQKKTEMAPIKNVAAKPEEQEVTKPQEKPVKPETPAEAEDAEVSLSEEKPTPVPPKPTPESKKPTPVPAKPTARPSVAPTKAPTKQKTDGENVDKKLQAALQRYLGESTDAGGKTFGGARAGIGKGGGGGEVRPPEFFAYLKLIRGNIRKGWVWPDQNTNLITQVAFRIEPDGRIWDISVAKSSGNGSFDETVVRAIMKASPLPPPPDSVYDYFKFVRTTFDPRE